MKLGINKINSLSGLMVFPAALLPGGQASMKSVSFLKDAGDRWLNGKAPDDDITFVVIKVTK